MTKNTIIIEYNQKPDRDILRHKLLQIYQIALDENCQIQPAYLNVALKAVSSLIKLEYLTNKEDNVSQNVPNFIIENRDSCK